MNSFVDLAEMHKQAVELLAHLDRQPSALHLRAGELALDITWADGGAPVAVVPVVPAAPPPVTGDYLRSPGVGVFYHAPEPGAEPFVAVGSQIQPGQQIGIIEAMKLMIPVEADRAGRITEVIKSNGAAVEYDEPLFALDTAEG